MSHNPWVSIWFSPRSTVARIAASNPNRSLWILASIYGFTSILNLFQSGMVGSQLNPVAILFIAAIFSPLWGYISFSIWSAFVVWTGKWFRGQGTFTTVRCAYAWSCVPFVFQIPLWVWMIFQFGRQLFNNFPDQQMLTAGQVSLLFVIMIVKLVLAIWSLVIYVNALAEVQNYSILRSILNLVVAGIVVVVLLVALWFLVFIFMGASTSHSMTTLYLWHEGAATLRELLHN